MAIEKPTLTPPAWANPVWPHRLPDAAQMRNLYGSFADELVVRFDDKWYPDVVVVPITTPRRDYAGLMVASDSGDVIGVHVYPLVAKAVERHPAWRAAAEPAPAPQTASRIGADIKKLFDRYGIDDPEGS
jgi:hypothetical protein